VAQKRGLNDQTQAMAASRTRGRRGRWTRTCSRITGSLGRHRSTLLLELCWIAAGAGDAAPQARAHTATRQAFNYLPAGFEVGKEPIGDVRRTAEGNEGTLKGTRPLVDVLFPPSAKPGTRISDHLTGNIMPNGNKCNQPSKTWTASDQSTAEDYALKHG
jgi:hypothetical protein